MLPTISTRTGSHVGAVKPSLNGCIHSASVAGTSRLELPSLITPPNRRPGRLARSRSAANPALDHIGFNASQAENGQSPAQVRLRMSEIAAKYLNTSPYLQGRFRNASPVDG